MSNCRFCEKCPMYPKFKNNFGLKIFQQTYCTSQHHTRCHRYQLASQGTMPPPDLLPNGKTLAEK